MFAPIIFSLVGKKFVFIDFGFVICFSNL